VDTDKDDRHKVMTKLYLQ